MSGLEFLLFLYSAVLVPPLAVSAWLIVSLHLDDKRGSNGQ